MDRTRVRISPLLLILCSSCLAFPAHAGVIRGNVLVPKLGPQGRAFQPYAGKASSLPATARAARGSVTDVVLSVAAISPEVDSALPESKGPFQLAQVDQSFVPRVIAVAVGTEVDFPNRDPIYHNVFSVSPPARFDLGKYPRGQSRRVRMAKPGLVKVFCDIHSDMAAFIVVLPNRAYTRPNDAGAFQLPELPPGRYTLTWWHPDFPAGTRAITVPSAGDITVDVVL